MIVEGRQFESCSPKDFLVGDILWHPSWSHDSNMKIHNSSYEVLSNDGTTVKAISARNKQRQPEYTETYTYHQFGEGWVREVKELKYDPKQQGDRDDDI